VSAARHYTFAPQPPSGKQNQWLTPCEPARSVEDGFETTMRDLLEYWRERVSRNESFLSR
jgi:hypothetical protein